MNNNRLYQKYKKRLDTFSVIIFSLILFLIISFFSIQVFFSNSYKDEIFKRTKIYKVNKGQRGSIFDRNNNLLAYSIKKCRFWVNSNDNNINSKDILNLFSDYLNDNFSIERRFNCL